MSHGRSRSGSTVCERVRVCVCVCGCRCVWGGGCGEDVFQSDEMCSTKCTCTHLDDSRLRAPNQLQLHALDTCGRIDRDDGGARSGRRSHTHDPLYAATVSVGAGVVTFVDILPLFVVVAWRAEIVEIFELELTILTVVDKAVTLKESAARGDGQMSMRACVRVCARARVCVCACVCVRARVCVCGGEGGGGGSERV
jgi:hypothetical protein